MSFDGDLEHLPIVDVIQLLHATGKSGTLTLKSAKGESQLVFHDGFIVCANHVNNSVRIGQVMLDMGLIAKEDLERALHEQQRAGAQRKPIIQTLIEGGMVETDTAYKGLEALIEMTIVEVLTWTKGTFSLDVHQSIVSDEYRYFPETVKREIHLNTQNLLMDALRIYDERKRDGTLTPEAMFGATSAPPGQEAPESGGEMISAADLGLEELDELERRIPHFFSAIAEELPDTPATRLQSELAGIPADEQRKFFDFLDSLSGADESLDRRLGVILLTGTKLLRECAGAVCGSRFLCATDEAAQLDPIIDQALSKERLPLLLFDAEDPGARGSGWDIEGVLRQKRNRYPDLPIVLLASPGDYQVIARALEAGVTASLPRPSREERPATFIQDTIDSSRALSSYLKRSQAEPSQELLKKFRRQFLSLSEQREPPEVTFLLLQNACTYFQRGVTLVVVRSELIAERAIGVSDTGATSSMKLRIPISEPSLFQSALEGEMYYGDADPTVRSAIFGAIGAPAASKVLLLPVKSFGRVVAVIYADFGTRTGGDPQLPLLEILAMHASMAIDNALYRKRCAQK
ncbi:MAG TPA: histidine kinase [Geobacter sp.]|nr:histidine kinase [Geobacter sp.]